MLISAVTHLIKEYGDVAIDVLNYTKNIQQSSEMLAHNYDGTYNSQADFIRDFMKNEFNDYTAQYIDFEKMASDFFEDNFLCIHGTGGKVHIFLT